MSHRRDDPPPVRLPAQWEPIGAVLMAWPSAHSDWAPWLVAARETVTMIISAIAPRARVILLTDDLQSLRELVRNLGPRLTVVELPTNDTWTRDYGPITVLERDAPRLLDFGFNGWGLKFAADLDNQATSRLVAAGHLGAARLDRPGLWLEGGAIESDGRGRLLTTTRCLLSPNRHPHLDRDSIDAELRRWLGVDTISWLEHGHLDGDDTDAHIDTLARLCPHDTIAYVRCDDPSDAHYPAFCAMQDELRALRTSRGEPYRLVPLPWPRPCFATDGHRLPATYANYLVVNGAVLMPTYGDPTIDATAVAAIAEVYPEHEIVGIDCRVLIEQHGSLHCMTMHIPKPVFTWKPSP